MSMTVLALFLVGSTLVIGAGASASAPLPPAPVATPQLPDPVRSHDRGDWFRHVCAGPEGATAGCGAQVVSNADGTPLASVAPPSSAYGPAQFHAAYHLPTGPSTQTIGIVDAFDDPTIEADLAAYDSVYGLPACTTANGCFKKVNQSGGTTYPSGSSWHLEIALDVETAHEICQTCKILLVEATNNSIANLGTAVNRAVAMGASVVTNSYGAGEYSGETTDENTYFNHPGVAITASSGDGGYGVEFPAASKYVTAVGGTTLTLNADNSWKSEAVWSGAGSGCSAYEPKPTWQTDTSCPKRTVADVSADADPNTGAAVYDSVGTKGGKAWYQVGGTSLAAPLIGAVYALAANGSVNAGSTPYAHTTSLHDVASGSNGSCGSSYLCTGKAGFDGPSGLGTPNGIAAFSATPPTPSFTLAASPSSSTVTAGNSATYTVTVTGQNGFAGPVALSASGLPAGATASFSPASTSTTSTLTVTTTAGTTPAGSTTLTITGTSGGVADATATATLVVQVPSFTLAASPSSATVTSGNSATYTVTVTGHNGFAGPVALSASGLPIGATASFSPASTSTTSTLTVTTTAGTTPAASTTLTITGTSSGVANASTTAGLIVQVPSFTLTASPGSRTVVAGTGTTYAVTVTPVGGFSGSVDLSASGLPSGAGATFSPASTATGSTLTITTAATVSPGSYPFAISGTSDALAGGTTATLIVQAPVTGPTVTVSTSSAVHGSTVTVTWANVASASTTDWIGIYVHGSPNTSYVNWLYTSSCSQQAKNPAHASGSCSFKLPATTGTYEFRLLSNNGYTVLATSSLITAT
jgi:hypothetical protein